MKTSLYLFIVISFSFFSIKGYAGGPCTPIANNSCGNAVSLTSGNPCVNGSTCSGGVPAASSACIAGAYECSWFSFVATGTDMFVDIPLSATSGCHFRTEVFSGNCGSLTSLSCQSGAPNDDLHALSGLTIGNTYYVQVCYAPGGPCGNGGWAETCIRVGEPDPPCNTCAAPCGTAAGYPTAPTVAQVVADCQTSPFIPELQPGSTHTFCYDFVATATSVDFNVIITSNCGGGNVTNFSWSLYAITCGAPIQTGTLASLTFSPVTIGTAYVFCYTFDVPGTCTHSQHCPYFVGATILPVTLANFDAEVVDNSIVELDWLTQSEINNDYYTVERSKDGQLFEVVGLVNGAGNSSKINSYNMVDDDPYNGTSYYRLMQTDYDGSSTYSRLVNVNIKTAFNDLVVMPNPVENGSTLTFNANAEGETSIAVYNIAGERVLNENYLVNKGNNIIVLSTEHLSQGMYFLQVGNGNETTSIKIIKN